MLLKHDWQSTMLNAQFSTQARVARVTHSCGPHILSTQRHHWRAYCEHISLFTERGAKGQAIEAERTEQPHSKWMLNFLARMKKVQPRVARLIIPRGPRTL